MSHTYSIKQVPKTNTKNVVQSFPQRKTLNRLNEQYSLWMYFSVPLKRKISEREQCRTTCVCVTAGKTSRVVLFLFFFSNTGVTISTERLHCANTCFFGLVHHQKKQPSIVTLEIFSISYLQTLQMKIPKRICQSSAAMCMAVQLHEKGWPILQHTALHYDYLI